MEAELHDPAKQRVFNFTVSLYHPDTWRKEEFLYTLKPLIYNLGHYNTVCEEFIYLFNEDTGSSETSSYCERFWLSYSIHYIGSPWVTLPADHDNIDS